MLWFQRLFRRSKKESELNQETQLRIDRGESSDEAMQAVRRDFGNVALTQEATRQVWGWTRAETFARDLRYAARLLRRSPWFAAAVIVSLTLGIGATTAIFSLMDLVMLRMLPVREPERLVQIQKLHGDSTRGRLSYPIFQQLRRDLRTFDGLLAQSAAAPREVIIGGRQETANVQLVSDNYHQLLGVNALVGRAFHEPVGPVAVISHGYWRRRFASDPAVVGRTFQLDKALLAIAGVMPQDFTGTVAGETPDIMIPISMDGAIRGGRSWTTEPGISWVSVMGRLRAGATLEQARTETTAVFARILDENKTMRPAGRPREYFLAQRLAVDPASNGFDDLRREFSAPLAILMGAAGLMLLMGCANIATLLLARCAARRHEIAVRRAIGAGRGRIVRQLLTEGLLLSAIGGALGVWLAVWLGNWLIAMMANGGARIAVEVRPDARVLAFACGASLAACLLFSLAPAQLAARDAVHSALARSRSGRSRLGQGLVVAQAAISLLLLIGAGLFGRTLYNMDAQDPGFDRRGVVTFWVNTAKAGYAGDRITDAYQRILAELRSLPAVTSASATMFPPISGAAWDGSLTVEGYTHAPQESDESHLNAVAPDYFRTMGTPVLTGREFDERDTPASKPVAIVNESFARRYFQDQSPLGRWVARSGPDRERFEIVGVVKDAKYRDLRLVPPRTVYFAASQQERGRGWNYLVVRTAMDAPAVWRSVEAALGRVDPSLQVMEPRTMDELMARSLLHERILAMLTGSFSGFALLLAAVGIYGLMAYQVARRSKEIGIRIALGARPRKVVAMVVGQTARLVLSGSAIGVLGALALTSVTEKSLYGITPTDPATFAAAVTGLALVAAVAAYLPGRAAARIHPIESLRSQ